MYNISAGIFSAFNSKNTKAKVYAVNHSQEKRDRMKNIFPIKKYNNFTKENFIFYNLYVNFHYSPSSLESLYEKLNTLDISKALSFKNEIINYKKFLREDIERINIEESNISIGYMINQFRKNKIRWFTLYFYILSIGNTIENTPEISKSRINKKAVEKIQKLLLYVSFSDESIKEFSKLMRNTIEIEES
jgi:hypothetical protein